MSAYRFARTRARAADAAEIAQHVCWQESQAIRFVPLHPGWGSALAKSSHCAERTHPVEGKFDWHMIGEGYSGLWV